MPVQRVTASSQQLAELSELDVLRLAVAEAGQAAFHWTPGDDRIQWSTSLGHVPSSLAACQVNTGSGLQRVVHPDDFHKFRMLMNSVSGEAEHFTFSFRVPGEMPEPQWVEARGICLKSETGVERIIGIMRDVSDERESVAKLERLAMLDDLTGQINRTSLRDTLDRCLEFAQAGHETIAFAVAAIDGLAVLNEAYGFEVADAVIVGVCRRLESVLRPGDVIGRISGNKFGVILRHCSQDMLPSIAGLLREAVRAQVIPTPWGPVSASVSLGAVLLPEGARSSQEAMLRAEEALDRAKTSGRDTFSQFFASPDQAMMRKRNIALGQQVLEALNEKRLRLAFQPIVAAETGEPVLHECLLRMMRLDGSIAPAGEFIPVAEQLGLVRIVDRRVLELAGDVLLANPLIRLSINVSGLSLGDNSWMAMFDSFAKAHPDAVNRLTVELTETTALHEMEEAARFTARVRAAGAKLAIDDFGAGYTSFRNLQALEVDMVKLDGLYVRGLAQNPDNQVFIKTLVGLARHLKIETVAEWVSKPEEVEILKALGVEYLQGFLFGQPSLNPDWMKAEV
ncbi:MAG: EAL domain-containing protein [Alphaproteobacteria bacterium]|nr:EAL domain-containing protein [Alphaproteobacteria bacterium]